MENARWRTDFFHPSIEPSIIREKKQVIKDVFQTINLFSSPWDFSVKTENVFFLQSKEKRTPVKINIDLTARKPIHHASDMFGFDLWLWLTKEIYLRYCGTLGNYSVWVRFDREVSTEHWNPSWIYVPRVRHSAWLYSRVIIVVIREYAGEIHWSMDWRCSKSYTDHHRQVLDLSLSLSVLVLVVSGRKDRC